MITRNGFVSNSSSSSFIICSKDSSVMNALYSLIKRCDCDEGYPIVMKYEDICIIAISLYNAETAILKEELDKLKEEGVVSYKMEGRQ